MCLRFLLGILKIAIAQEHLFSRLEGWHPKVGAVGAAESIPQVALRREQESHREANNQRKGHLRKTTVLSCFMKSASKSSSQVRRYILGTAVLGRLRQVYNLTELHSKPRQKETRGLVSQAVSTIGSQQGQPNG